MVLDCANQILLRQARLRCYPQKCAWCSPAARGIGSADQSGVNPKESPWNTDSIAAESSALYSTACLPLCCTAVLANVILFPPCTPLSIYPWQNCCSKCQSGVDERQNSSKGRKGKAAFQQLELLLVEDALGALLHRESLEKGRINWIPARDESAAGDNLLEKEHFTWSGQGSETEWTEKA